MATEDAHLRAIAEDQPPFGLWLGLKILSVTPDEVVGEFVVRPEFGNRNGVLHGGVVMGVADNMGGTATFTNLPEGASTSTIESKTNFFASVPMGATVRAVCTPLHRGRTTQVWQTKILRPDGKLAALVTQTQIIMRG